MIAALTMPAWGMEEAAGTVISWLVPEGAPIERGQELVEIETSKLTNVVELPYAGTLIRHVLVRGDKAPTGALLGVVCDTAASPEEIDAFVGRFGAAETGSVANMPEERAVETSRGQVQVVSLGREGGVPVVLLHGYGADGTSWSQNVPALASGHRVHVLDLPGHGASFKSLGSEPLVALIDAVGEVIAALGEGRVILIGHSLGGLVAARLAAARPDLVRGLVLIAPAGLGPKVDDDFLRDFAEADSRNAVREVLRRVVREPQDVGIAMVTGILRARRIEGARDALRALRGGLSDGGAQREDIAPLLRALAMPVSILTGEKDDVVTFEAGLPREMLPEAGHLMHMEQPSEVNRRLLAAIEAAG